MAKFVYFFIAALTFSAVLAKPKKVTTEKPAIEQFFQNVETARKDVEASLQKVLPDSKEVNKAILDMSKTFATTVEQGTKDLNEQTEKNKPIIQNLIKEASSKISESVAFIKGLVSDDVAKKGEEIRKNVESHIKIIFAEGKKVEDAIKPTLEHAHENIKQFATNFFQELASAGERLKADIDRTIAEKNAKH